MALEAAIASGRYTATVENDPDEPQGGPANPRIVQTSSFEIPLPKSDPPTRFEGKDRAQLNSWARACERFIEGNSSLTNPAAQVSFGLRWLGDHQVDYWERTLRAIPVVGRVAATNWSFLKQTMLDSLGSTFERKQLAREKIRNARQRQYTPTELLNYLKTQWEEINPSAALDDTNEDHIHDYYSALDSKIKERLDNVEQEWHSLVALEAKANQQYRALSTLHRPGRTRSAPDEYQRNASPFKRPRYNNDQREPPSGNGARPQQPLPPRNNTDHNRDGWKRHVECFNCHKRGHLKRDCPESNDTGEGKAQP